MAVVSWNTRELLDAACGRSGEGAGEVWVVDNGSTDGSASSCASVPWVRLVESDENLGYGRALNLVAERTESPWFALANADIALRPGALGALLAAGERDPGAGVIAPRLVLPGGATQHSWAFPTVPATLVQNAGPVLAGRLGDRLALRARGTSARGRVPWAVGAFLLVRRQAWEEVGGFDPGHWMSAEDLDFGWRMREAGWATRFEPRPLVDHESAATGRSGATTWRFTGSGAPTDGCCAAAAVRARSRPG